MASEVRQLHDLLQALHQDVEAKGFASPLQALQITLMISSIMDRVRSYEAEVRRRMKWPIPIDLP